MPENLSFLGFGLGLRSCHYETIIQSKPSVDWFEIVSEDFMVEGGAPLYYIEKIREHYPVVMHGVSLSIGSTDPLNKEYLKQLKRLIDTVDPRWVSDHFCWTGVDGKNTHGLLPMPFTQEAIDHIADRIMQVQEFLGRQILLENISSYVEYSISEMTEWEFITAIAEKADCLILFDVNNAYVNAYNHGFSAHDFISGIPTNRVQQFHMAGHSNRGTHIIDTHDDMIVDDVWTLYEASIERFGVVSTLIERDDNIPDLLEMKKELDHAQVIYEKAIKREVNV